MVDLYLTVTVISYHFCVCIQLLCNAAIVDEVTILLPIFVSW